MISDLHELVLKCRNEQARSYLREAVDSYNASAYRACIVTIWVAVVFDLIEKVRELALSGDGAANSIIETFERWRSEVEQGNPEALKKSLEFERNIIDQTQEKFEFFEHQQLVDLQRLREDRNRCAHPTYQRADAAYHPSAELARVHLRNAVEFVLSQAPVQGKAAVQSLINIVGSDFFPTDHAQALDALRGAGLNRPKDVLVKDFADKLLFGFFDGSAQLKHRRQTITALKACCEAFPKLVEPRVEVAINKICRQILDADLPLAFVIVRGVPQAWTLLQNDNRQKLIDFVRTAPIKRVRAVIRAALNTEGLRAVAEARLSDFDAEQLKDVLQSKDRAIVEQAVRLYSAAQNWVDANTIYEQVLQPLLSVLTSADVEKVVRASWNGADLVGAHSFRQFLDHVYKQETMPRDKLVELLKEGGLNQEVARLAADSSDEVPF